MRFTKLHGTGNDFLVIDARDVTRDWSPLAEAMCNRHVGIGADGVMLVLPSDDADVRMRLFNADGSEAEMSGNGLRCFVKYVIDRGVVTAREGAVRVETLAGVLSAFATLANRRVEAVRVGMGQPRFAPVDVPVAIEAEPPIVDYPLDANGRTLAITCVSMGNPHAVHFVDAPVDGFPLEIIGPIVEQHPLFPNRVNFGVARVLARDRMEVRVWERGVGETLACGTGVSAAVVAARLRGFVDDAVEVQQPGGMLAIEWGGEGEVYLSGPAVEVFEGEWPEGSAP
ncbi:MAG: diaminopimelate epimerase [Dehalococcoidia bacterium]